MVAVAVVEKGKSTIAKAFPDTDFVGCSDTAPSCVLFAESVEEARRIVTPEGGVRYPVSELLIKL